MNQNDFLNNQSNSDAYHATSNLNTAIENPQMNINSAVEMNINSSNSENMNSNHFLDNSNFDQSNMNYQNNIDNSEFVNYNSPENAVLNNNIVVNNSNNNNSNESYYSNSINGFSDNISSNGSSDHQFIPDTSFEVENNETVSDNTSFGNHDTMYEPVMEKSKRTSNQFTISRELKITIFIVFILIIFIMLLPYIYDFFKELQLVITG